jgi:ubiquinol-cytochrome c reductase cytochrome c subunit
MASMLSAVDGAGARLRSSCLAPRRYSLFRLLPQTVLLLVLGAQLARAQQPAKTPIPAADIFAEHCAKCHGDRGQGVSGVTNIGGPNIQAVHDHADVMAAMEIGPSHMPSFARILTVDQMRAVADFVTHQIATIPKVQGDLGEGGELFRVYCSPCHRTAVRGGALVYTGINAPSLVDKSPAIIAGAIRWGPGPMPAYPPTVLDNKQLWSIVDYIQQVAQHPPARGGSPLNWYGPVAEGFVAWVVMFALIAVAGWIEKGGRG